MNRRATDSSTRMPEHRLDNNKEHYIKELKYKDIARNYNVLKRASILVKLVSLPHDLVTGYRIHYDRYLRKSYCSEIRFLLLFFLFIFFRSDVGRSNPIVRKDTN